MTKPELRLYGPPCLSAKDQLAAAERLQREQERLEEETRTPGEVCWEVLRYLDQLEKRDNAEEDVRAHLGMQRLAELLHISVRRTFHDADTAKLFDPLLASVRDFSLAALRWGGNGKLQRERLGQLIRLEISYLSAGEG